MEKIQFENIPEGEDIARKKEIRDKIEEETRRIDALPDEEIIKKATQMLNDLGLTFDDLRDKKVVDLGAAEQIIERAATIKGTGTVFSVDKRDFALSKRPEVKNGIVADIRDGIPQIEDNSIDLLISRGGPPAVIRKRQEVDFSINEILRMLKVGGEARLWRLFFVFIADKNERFKELLQKKSKDLTENERREKKEIENLIEEESCRYLKEKGLNVVKKRGGLGWSYGIIKKNI
ncbi:MAG: hypothetical protein PHS62_04725 [Patescibacteria group bacterium]|nr:hypothetical protein [Patescibacteria group bacterium]